MRGSMNKRTRSAARKVRDCGVDWAAMGGVTLCAASGLAVERYDNVMVGVLVGFACVLYGGVVFGRRQR